MKKLFTIILSLLTIVFTTSCNNQSPYITTPQIEEKANANDYKIFKTVEYDINNFEKEKISIEQTQLITVPWQLKNISVFDDDIFVLNHDVSIKDSEYSILNLNNENQEDFEFESYIHLFHDGNFNNYKAVEIPNSVLLKRCGNLIISLSNSNVEYFNKDLEKVKSVKIPETCFITHNYFAPTTANIINEKYVWWYEDDKSITIFDVTTKEEISIKNEIETLEGKLVYYSVYPTQNQNLVLLVGSNFNNDKQCIDDTVYAIADLTTGNIVEYINEKTLIDNGSFIDPWTTTLYNQIGGSKLFPKTEHIYSCVLENGKIGYYNKAIDKNGKVGYNNKILDFNTNTIFELEKNLSFRASVSTDTASYMLLSCRDEKALIYTLK